MTINKTVLFYNRMQNKMKSRGKDRELLESMVEEGLVMKQFRTYAAELDKKHDRYERIVKFSRDITIESKRIIFLLHSIDKSSMRERVLHEAQARLQILTKTLFKSITNELYNHDTYQYLRAYRSGLQEYVEACSFYNYLQSSALPHWSQLEENFYSAFQPEIIIKENISITQLKTRAILFPPHEYILGIADLTGELMRKCISNLSTGDITSCYETCNLVRDMYKGFLGCAGVSGKEISKKLYTLKQSLTKMENVCYTVRVRGSEVPRYMLADVANSRAENYPLNDDEGYQAY